MSCKKQWDAMKEAERQFTTDSDEFRQARGRYLACMEGVHDARGSHGASWDVKLMELAEMLAELAVWRDLDIPPRPESSLSNEVMDKVCGDASTALRFSRAIEKAFRESGIRLESDETFACRIYTMKKPEYVTELVGQAANAGAKPHVQYIMDPTIMRQAMKVARQDRIRYRDIRESIPA